MNDLRIISIAPQADPTRPDADASHFVGFQRDLANAARRLGHGFVALVPDGVDEGETTRPVIPRAALGRKVYFQDPGFVAAIDGEVGRLAAAAGSHSTLVLRYEGKLQELPIMAELAGRHPEVRFVWNLLAAPSGAMVPPAASIPSNLRILSDNVARHAWAIRNGLPSEGVWPLHSALAGLAGHSPAEAAQGGPLRILVALAAWQSDRSTRARVDYVIRRARAGSRCGSLSWTIAGHAPAGSSHERWARRIARHDVRTLTEMLPADAYRDIFAASPVVWFPSADRYAMKSSGKAIDALASGCVVVAPTGSFHAREAARWTGVDLDYETPDEAAAALAGLPQRIEGFQRALSDAQAEMQAAYEPVACLERIIEFAYGAKRASASDWVDVEDATSSGPLMPRPWKPAAPSTWTVARLRAGGRD